MVLPISVILDNQLNMLNSPSFHCLHTDFFVVDRCIFVASQCTLGCMRFCRLSSRILVTFQGHPLLEVWCSHSLQSEISRSLHCMLNSKVPLSVKELISVEVLGVSSAMGTYDMIRKLLLEISPIIWGSIKWPSVMKRKLITRLLYWKRPINVLTLVLTLKCVWIITMLLRCSIEIVWLFPTGFPRLVIMPNKW